MNTNEKFPADLYTYMKEHTLMEVKGGTTRPTFLKIWMVEVDGRVFARSWNKSERSWFTEFLRTGVGEIKYGDTIMKVKGKKIAAEDPVNPRISEAYLKKYNQPQNLPYAEGISKPEYFDYTMEFFPDPDNTV
ncbi:hypothetical protein SAMN04488034_103146 [Salinimicrobium catena]|uniref:DUF2255 family protein n=1 Tax=Salinimicrobium catena TaxID=390640 RepID=A0A1H5MW14_9FLAO|nr:DUF2255 family protein [Salinimicrobium catena]SDL30933.1 hypothetical protein SAMN04488140_103146 [Salinimicrobium catena]SEE93483.1 hypothetical protein SAMN04488034_103146 [Salinimicrobium catena]